MVSWSYYEGRVSQDDNAAGSSGWVWTFLPLGNYILVIKNIHCGSKVCEHLFTYIFFTMYNNTKLIKIMK